MTLSQRSRRFRPTLLQCDARVMPAINVISYMVPVDYPPPRGSSPMDPTNCNTPPPTLVLSPMATQP